MTDAAIAADPPRTATERIARVLALAAATAAVACAIWLLGDVLTVVFAGILGAAILHGLARTLRRLTGLPHGAAIAIVLLVVAALFGVFVWQVGPRLAHELVEVGSALRSQADGLRSRLSETDWGRIVLGQIPSRFGGTQGGDSSGGLSASLAGPVANYVTSALGTLGTLLVVTVTAIYFALSPSIYANGFLRLIPPRGRPAARIYAEAAGHALWSWSVGQAADMLVVATLTSLGLWLLGVPLAFALGVLAGLFNFVPYVGAIVAAVPAIAVALTVSATTGLEAAALLLAIQTLEGNVIAPLIQRRAIDLPPGLTILAQTLFGALLGLPGFILATPLAAALLAVGDRATAPLADDERLDH